MDHLVQLSPHLAERHLPGIGGRHLQHQPRGGAAQPHRLDEVAHAARAVGVLVAVGALVAWRLHDAHARPVGVELVGDDHRQGSARGTVTHLGAMGDDRDDAVAADGDEHLGVADDAVGHGVGAGRIGRERPADGRELRRQHEPAGCSNALEQAAPADVGDRELVVGVELGHVTPPWLRRERPREYAGSSRTGTGCRTWPRLSRHQWAPACAPAGRPPA